MGSCLSSSLRVDLPPPPPPSAKVISLAGDLHEYPASLPVFLVLHSETSSSPGYFLCNSDSLYYDDHIPPLDSDDKLQLNQIYFVLPKSELRRPLTTADMAALAVKASVALQNASTSEKGTHRRKKARISPFIITDQGVSEANDAQPQMTTTKKSLQNSEIRPDQMLRSGSVRKLQRLASRSKAIRAVRSFKLRLTTIYEGTIL